MNIYNKDGSLLLSVPVTSNAKYVRELAGDCYILLSWYAPYGTPLDAGTYIEHNGAKYALLDTYTPRMNTEASWLYEPQFKPQEMAWSKIPFFFYNGDSRESDWTLTSDAPDFLECVLKAIKNETGEEYTFSTDVTGTITLQFSSTDILSGLNQIADGFKTEWWVKDKVIHLSRCIDDTKTEITLSIGENVGIPSVSEKSEGYYNRFYVFGSTRNIVQGYSGANVNNLTNKRLTLDPVKYPNGYYQLTDGTFSKVLIYEDIYPAATNIEIVSLMSRTDYVLDDNGKKIQIGTDSEGNPIWDMFTVWYMKIAYKNPDGTYTDFEFNDWNYTDDPNVHAGKEGMLIPGLKVSVSFASGPLMGREFELAYIKSDTTIKTSSGSIIVPKGYFEILYTKENDYIIPDSAYLVPVEGNNVVLFNIKMPDIYIQDAYDRLEAAMKKDIEEKYLSDLNQYTFETYPGAFGSIDIGAPVAFGTLKTRVVSVSYNLETPSVFEITIGNELQKGTIQQLVDDTLTANKNIEIIAALNKTTEAIANAYTRTYQEILKQFDLISSIFELDTTSVAGKTLIHAKYDGLYSDGDIAAGGAFAGTPSGGGKTYLNELLDVQLATSSLNVGDMLMWNGDKYVNIPQSSITPDLSAYATQQWVLDKKYLTSVPVASVVGQTGNITTAQVATALTDAGYKLTDTTYELATTTSNGLMSSSDKVKLNNIEEGANKYIHPTTAGYKHIPSGGSSGQILRWSADGTAVWGEDKDTTYSPATQSANGLMSATDKTKLDGIAENANNYTLPTASSSTKGGIKVGTTLSISGEFLNLKSGFPKGTYTKVQIDDYGRVSSGSTLSASDIPSLPWSKITSGKPTTISGYGITDAYTKTETDNKVAALQSLLDSMFERVYDSNNKLIRIHSNVTISSSGDLVAGDNSEGGGTSGGAYTQLEWNAIKALTQSESGLLASAYAVKEAYNELNTAIETLAGKATNVTFTQTLTSGTKIGAITVDGTTTNLYAPTPPTKVSQLTNDSGYITGITKAMVEGVLTGNITTHTHSYLPLAGGTMSNTNVVTNLNADLLDGYHATMGSNQPWGTIPAITSKGWMDVGRQFEFHYDNTYSSDYSTMLRCTGNYDNIVDLPSASGTLALLTDNVASSSKWETPRTITLTGSVTGSVSIDGSQNVSLATTTNHTHTFASLTDKPTTLSGYGITDALPLIGGALSGGLVINTPTLPISELTTDGITSNNTWNSAQNVNLLLRSANNAMTISLGGQENERKGIIQVGHASSSYANFLGDLYLNKFGGNVYIGEDIAYHAGNANKSDVNWSCSTMSSMAIGSPYSDVFDANNPDRWINSNYGSANSDYSNMPVGWEYGTVLTIGQQNYRGINGFLNAQFVWDVQHGKDANHPGRLWWRTKNENTGWKNWQELLHTANFNSYAPKLDGTGATGTWGISISGNAATATKLATSRTIWGQSFDGTGNVSGALTGVTSITASGHAKVNSLKANNICIECDNNGNSHGRGDEINNYNGPLYLQHNTSNNCFICTGGGNVGIGTTSPSYKLHIVGTAYASENIIASGDLTAGSDIRYKDKIQDLRLSIHDIALAPAFTYKWNNRKDDALIHIGSSAQYWLNTNAKDAVYYDKQNDFYHLNYASLALCNTIILARGMETQEEKISRLEERINELEDKLRQYGINR